MCRAGEPLRGRDRANFGMRGEEVPPLFPRRVDAVGRQSGILMGGRAVGIAPGQKFWAAIVVGTPPRETPHVVERPHDRRNLQTSLQNFGRPVRPVNVVDVDDVRLQGAQIAGELPANRLLVEFVSEGV